MQPAEAAVSATEQLSSIGIAIPSNSFFHPCHIGKVFLWALVLIAPPVAAVAALYVTSYTAFTDHTLIECPLGSPGTLKIRDYEDIYGMYTVRGYHARFNDHVTPYFVIAFKDGSRWQTSPGHRGDTLAA